MKTNKANVNTVMNNNGTTTLICGNCGAELVIPQQSTFVAGMTLGKDSGHGTVVVPVVNGNGNCQCKPNIDVSAIVSNPELLTALTSLMTMIDESGYLDVNDQRFDRRWVTGQTLAMQESSSGFHQNLKWKGYDYGWKVLLDDLKAQEKMQRDGIDGKAVVRMRFYNKDVAYHMAKRYIAELKQHFNTLRRHKCKGREYVKLRSWMNWKGTFTNEFEYLIDMLESHASAISNSYGSPQNLYHVVRYFVDKIHTINFKPKELAPEFINVYKAVGGYYTMRSLIMFEDCRLMADGDKLDFGQYFTNRRFVSREKSLELLDKYLGQLYEKGMCENGYKMLGLLRVFLEYNNFDYEATKAKWEKQSEVRRVARAINKNRRPRK